jgi:hypothetical protein
MNTDFATASEAAPLEIIDLQVTTKRLADKSLLSVHFFFRKDRKDRRYQMPPLSWFDAGQFQRFSEELAAANHPDKVQVDLVDAGIRLTGYVRRLAGRWNAGRTIQVEPLPTAEKQFKPFSLYASHNDVKTHAQKLYSRLWEVFTRG